MLNAVIKLGVMVSAAAAATVAALQVSDLAATVKEVGLFATAVIVFLAACYGLFKYFAARLDATHKEAREERKEWQAQMKELELLRHQDSKELREALSLHNDEIRGLKALLEALTSEVRRRK